MQNSEAVPKSFPLSCFDVLISSVGAPDSSAICDYLNKVIK